MWQPPSARRGAAEASASAPEEEGRAVRGQDGLRLGQPSSHPAAAASSSASHPAAHSLQRPRAHGRSLTEPPSTTAQRPDARHPSPGAPAAPGDLHQLPPEPAALAGRTLPLGLREQLSELTQHPTQHALATCAAPQLPAQRQSEQPVPAAHHRATRPATPQLQSAAAQTTTKDLQTRAATPAPARPVAAGERREQPVEAEQGSGRLHGELAPNWFDVGG